jgi:K+-transporting ATPase c subunit
MSDTDERGDDGAECVPLPASAAKMGDQIRPAILSVLVLTLLTGCAFPLLLAAIGRPLFPREAGGSLLTQGGVVIGSELIGQEFSRPEYFHPGHRRQATATMERRPVAPTLDRTIRN